MALIGRRVFLAAFAGAFTAACESTAARAAASSMSRSFPSFLPNRLTVDCASRQNFRLLRQNTDYIGLAGTVSQRK
jgi:hypothetical protein